MSLFSGIKIVSQIPCDLDKILALWYIYLANTCHHCIIPVNFFSYNTYLNCEWLNKVLDNNHRSITLIIHI